nr:putative capsid protein [Cressdnaviricota sp.]
MEYVAGASGATLGFIAGDVPGAYTGYQIGKKAYNFFTENKSMPGKRKQPPKNYVRASTVQAKKKFKSKGKTMAMVKKRMSKSRTGSGKVQSGSYRGRFKKPGKLVKDIKAKAGKIGWSEVVEFAGSVIDNDCIYIQFSNYNQQAIMKSIVGAILRQLFRGANIDISNQEQELPLNSPDKSQFNADNVYVITFVSYNPIDHNQTFEDYVIGENATLRSVKDAVVSLANHLGQYIIGYMSNGSFRVPYSINLYRNVHNLGRILQHSITFENLMIEMEMNSTLTTQNSTRGSFAAEGNFEADRTDNQPLKGSLFQFKNADPRLKQTQTRNTGVLNNDDWVLSSGLQRGINAYGSALFPYNVDREPPNARLWKNIKKSSGVTLEPGQIKKTTLSNKYKNTFFSLMKKLKADVDGTVKGLPIMNGVQACQSALLVLEERIRTPLNNPIQVNWEMELRNYCIVTQKKASDTHIRGGFLSEELIQWVPT